MSRNNLCFNSFNSIEFVYFHKGQEFTVVSTPPFAESVTEGDVKWEKGESLSLSLSPSLLYHLSLTGVYVV